MKNDLTLTDKQEIATLSDKQLEDVIKPLTIEIHLFDSFVAGTLNIKDKNILNNIKVDDKLTLIREDSKFDSNTINIYTADKIKIGYIPEKDNAIFARLMDAGKLLIAKVKNIEIKGSFTTISIGIYLVDY